MKNFINPYYLVDFNSSICNFKIYINDIPVFTHNGGGIISSHYPINHFILESGEQKIKFKIFPLEGETILKDGAFLKIKVHAYDDYTNNYENLLEAFNFETPDLSNPKLPVIEIEAKFNADIPYKIPGWKNSFCLEDVDKIKNELISFYEEIYELARTQNSLAFYKLLKTRLDEIDTAMYIRNEDNLIELRNMFNNLNEENFFLEDFPKLSNIEIYAENRIFNLLRNDKNPILHYVNKITNEEFNLPLFVHKKVNSSNFEIIR